MMDLTEIYKKLVFSRRFEEEVKILWDKGLISGEMHLGIGEEMINIGIVSLLKDGDALALDHRGTSAMLTRGVNPTELLLEFLGHSEGISGGLGGHMHLFSQKHKIVSSGIVGASGPAAVGFGLSTQYQKKNNIAVAFFGEGALNQGMMMESMNMASALSLPVLFVCKDNKMAISTESIKVTGGSPSERAKGFGIDAVELEGKDIREIITICGRVISDMRQSPRPFLVHIHCIHKDGHFLGDPLLGPLDSKLLNPVFSSIFRKKGVNIIRRNINAVKILFTKRIASQQQKDKFDPLEHQLFLTKVEMQKIYSDVNNEISRIIDHVMHITEGRV